MTSDSFDGIGGALDHPRVWAVRLATTLAIAARDLRTGARGKAGVAEDLERTLDAFLAEYDPSDELADTIAQIRRLPNVERGAPQ